MSVNCLTTTVCAFWDRRSSASCLRWWRATTGTLSRSRRHLLAFSHRRTTRPYTSSKFAGTLPVFSTLTELKSLISTSCSNGWTAPVGVRGTTVRPALLERASDARLPEYHERHTHVGYERQNDFQVVNVSYRV